jgi:hypothetical protein
MRAFVVYIRPVVEYNSVVWNPCTVHLIDILESVQRSCTKRNPSISKLTYAERLAHLGLDTLELRRLRFDLIFYYKVFNYLTPFDPQTVFGIYHPPACLRSNTLFIQKPAHMSNKTLATLFTEVLTRGTSYLPIYAFRNHYSHSNAVLEMLNCLDF